MSTTSQHPTVTVGWIATILSRAMPLPSFISLNDTETNAQGSEWIFDRVDGADGAIYLPHGPVNPSGSPEELPLTAEDPFIPDKFRTYIAKTQTAHSKNPSDWHLKEINHRYSRGPPSEGVARESAVRISFEVPLAEGPLWRIRSQLGYLFTLTGEVLGTAIDRSEGS